MAIAVAGRIVNPAFTVREYRMSAATKTIDSLPKQAPFSGMRPARIDPGDHVWLLAQWNALFASNVVCGASRTPRRECVRRRKRAEAHATFTVMLTDTNRDLLCRLTDLLRREHGALADFLLVLAEFDERRGWAELGYASLFDFLHRELRLSKGTAFYRKTATGLVQRYPEVVDALRDGRLCMSSVVELAKVITPENRTEVLPRFFHCSREEAKAVSAELSPMLSPPVRAIVTTAAPVNRVLDLAQAVQPLNRGSPGSPDREAPMPSLLVPPQFPAASDVRHDETVPLTADLRRLHVTVSKRFLDKLDAARSALSHSIPGATTEQILEAALDLVLAKDAKKKGLVAKPRPAPTVPPEPGVRYVPAAVRRAVWKRDQGRCQWPLENGGICGSTYKVELDHAKPVRQGGRSTVEGTRVLCEPHNDESARRAYGEDWMNRFTRRRRKKTG